MMHGQTKSSEPRRDPQPPEFTTIDAMFEHVRRLALRYIHNHESTESAMQMLQAIQGRRGRPA